MSGTYRKSLTSLFKKIPIESLSEIPDIRISGISSDSRKIRPGWLFAAVKGESADGFNFIPQAIDNGAVAVMGSRPIPEWVKIPYIHVLGDMSRAVAYVAAGLNGFPARKLRMVGVTGTDGKTTTTSMIFHILRSAGIKAGMISTVSAVIGDTELDTGFHVTTPEATDIQAYLSRMVKAGLTHCVLETTSHGLAQGRVLACDFDLAVITNVTHEHLDYHGSYQKYLESKGKLFESLGQTPRKGVGNIRVAILNKDDRSYDYLKRISPGEQISYSMINEATIWADAIHNDRDRLSFDCHYSGGTVHISSPMVGIYNVSNCLAAFAATVLCMGVSPEIAIAALGSLPSVPGRMEQINLGQDFTAIVDFAHTPNGLLRALETARGLTNGKVIAVFGSAGLRDREKRKLMPKTSIRCADLTILTAEDPRTESLEGILQDMADAAVEEGGIEGQDFWRIPDRGAAIRKAIDLSKPGDLVIVCGKGHEQSMCFGDTEYTWDDRIALRAALSERLGIEGPRMPSLPTSSS